MELIVDANVFMSALIATEGKTFDLMWNEHLKLFSVEFMFKELEKHKLEILEKSGLSSPEFEVVVSLLSSRIEFIPFSDFKELVSLAEKISPDKNDAEYFALALKLGCGI